MGFEDRDYYREPAGRSYRSPGSAGSFGSLAAHLRLWNVTTWLIAINVAVFLIDQLTGRLVSNWGYFSIAAAIYYGQLWRFLTFQFLHAGFDHIFFNMLALYFFGPMVENYLGPRRFLAFYLLSGIGGALGYILLFGLHLLITDPLTPLIGASAGIFGILIAAVQIAPDARVMLLFPPIPLKLKTLAWIMIGIAVYTVFAHGFNAGGEAAHLGGAAVGALLIRFQKPLSLFDLPFLQRLKRRPRMRLHRGSDWDPFRSNPR